MLGHETVLGTVKVILWFALMTDSANCLIVTSIFPPIHGGSATVYENIARYSNGRVAVLAPYRNYQTGRVLVGWLDYDKSVDFKVYRMELLRSRETLVRTRLESLILFLTRDIPLRLEILWKLRSIIRRKDIKVVCIGELISGSWMGWFAKRFLGCKVINYIHGEEVTTKKVYRFFGRSKRKFLHRADAVIAVSRFTKKTLMEVMELGEQKIELIFNGVDLQAFHEEPTPDFLLDRYGLRGKLILLTVGRLIPRKGIDRVIQALPRIMSRVTNIHYLIVGDGPYRTMLEELVEENGLQGQVTLAGRVDQEELCSHYVLCDLFVMPNREIPDGDTEGFGLVFLEANACGKPVIAGKAGGTGDAVRDGYNGYLVDGDNIEEIADTIIRILDDPALYRRMQQGALEFGGRSDTRARTEQFLRLCERLVL